jgi:hypothetical protein
MPQVPSRASAKHSTARRRWPRVEQVLGGAGRRRGVIDSDRRDARESRLIDDHGRLPRHSERNLTVAVSPEYLDSPYLTLAISLCSALGLLIGAWTVT